MKSIFKDDEFRHIEDDIEKIRLKTGMYIPYKGSAGAKHLVQELIDNAIDEINNPESPADICQITYDENKNEITVSDNGRGIPFEHIETLCTKIQAGSKFDRNNGDDSAGENGVGLTAVNALSHYFKVETYRQFSDTESSKGVYEFSEGKLLKNNITSLKSAKHGTVITIIPSTQILGECKLDTNELLKWIEKLSYVTDEIPIILKIKRNGSDKFDEKYRFRHPNGIVEYINSLVSEELFKPIYIKTYNTKENISSIKLTFTYNPNKFEETVDSFTNRVNTIEGGYHVNAAKSALSCVLTKAANDTLSAADKKKFEVTDTDCRAGLVMIISLSCKFPGYVGQQKEKCGNRELFYPIRNVLIRELNNYFEENPKTLSKIVSYLKKVAKARISTVRIRKADISGIDSFKSNKMANFSDATEDSEYNELYLIEGLSAKGSIMKARDPRFQAALSFKGVTANALFMSPSQILKNPEYSTLVKVSGLGLGKSFNIDNSRFKRYIISTDADIDGWKISSGIASFFLFHWPEVVKAGMLYVALTPLYMIDRGNGNFDYLVSKAELFEEKVKSYIDKAVIRTKDGHVMTKQEMKSFLIKNKDYEDILKELYTHEYVHPDIIEFVLGHWYTKNSEKEFHKRFPEIKLNRNKDGTIIFSGSYNGVYQFLMCDKTFVDKSRKLVNAIREINNDQIYYDYKEKDSDQWIEDCSLGFILKSLKKYDLEIKHRWKGLGSIPPKIFWDIVMNPSKRSLIQLTIEDIERDMEMMKILHGQDADLRRKLLQSYKLDKDDIDS